MVLGCVIDSEYHGNVRLVLYNRSHHEFDIAKGDRIARLICECFQNHVPKETVLEVLVYLGIYFLSKHSLLIVTMLRFI
jgi:dUTPase